MAVDNTHFKGSWRPEEDAALREAVSRHGEKNWSTVARTFNQLMGRPALLGRAPKQCRSRYLQQLVPGIKTGEWSIEEEEILVEGHKQFGNQWTLIASMLPGRTETSVKNHYNCTARRKVPADPNRMTILQRYLAAIGIISAPGGSKGGSGAAAKYPSLGSGYPNSNSGMYYQGAGTGTTATSSAAAAAAAAAAGKAAASRSRRGTSAPAAVHSPSASHMGYDEYEGTTELAHAYSEADYTQAYAAYQAYQSMEQQQQHMAAAAAAAAAAAMQHDHADAEGEDEVAAEGGAADGLLQLAHAAMMHLEELGGEGDDDDEEDEEGEEGAGSGNGEARQRSASKQQQHAAGEECYADNEHEHEQQQHQQVAASSTGKGGEVAAAGSKAGSKSPAGRPLPAWLKPDLALSVMSSEESDRTAEEPDEGSPLAEQLLRQHLKSGSKRGSPSTAAAAALGGRTQPASGAAPGAKRPRSIWGAEEAAVAAAAAAGVGAGGSVDAAAAAGALAGAAAGRRFTRPVLDVSEPEGTGSCVPPPLSLPVGPVSPGVPSVGSNSAPLSELNAHLVAMLMGAFMGAADSSAASAPASALPTDALAAIARVMASSLAAAGQSQQQQHQSSPPPPAVPSKMPASQLAAQGDA